VDGTCPDDGVATSVDHTIQITQVQIIAMKGMSISRPAIIYLHAWMAHVYLMMMLRNGSHITITASRGVQGQRIPKSLQN